ncbi:MAG: hypothetical protein NTY36_03025, partial [Deltaproteobacteria bacterium]|nr:hypothetical protein [Deltaproteobacteria bacterium]
DFASMYPTIMAIHNISPETVNCTCCAEAVASSQLPVASKAVDSGQWSVVSNVEPPPSAVPAPALRVNDEMGFVGARRTVPYDSAGKIYVEQPPSAVVGATRWVAPAFPDNPPVPEAGYHLCRRREGLVPRTLKPILALREQLKARAKEVGPEEARPYKERQTALKWMLVTCFGYLGYKNARFGRIEAHEAVTAHGRDKLLTAKEISEAAGFTVLHGLTDCLWLQKTGVTEDSRSSQEKLVGAHPCVRPHKGGHAGPPLQKLPGERGVKKSPFGKGGFRGIWGPITWPAATTNFVNHHDLEAATKKEHVEPPPSAVPAGGAAVPGCLPLGGHGGPPHREHFHLEVKQYETELEDLCTRISAATGVKLALEGVYRWLCFMPSKQDPKRPVATRYFGVFEDGSLKVRGLACRRRDTPPFVRRAQEALLAKLTEAVTPDDLLALRPELEEMAECCRRRLREGRVRPLDLVITRVLSQKVADYKVDTPTALAARQLQAAGIHLQPGEKVRYVHAEKKGGPKETRIQAAPFLDTLDNYDVGLYLDLLERAIAEVMLPFGELQVHTAP